MRGKFELTAGDNFEPALGSVRNRTKRAVPSPSAILLKHSDATGKLGSRAN